VSAHELAQLLLAGPDLPVACEDGMDPSDLCEVQGVDLASLRYWDDGERREKEVVRIYS
jgi:hypothetical protein